MKALVATFYEQKALIGAFSGDCENFAKVGCKLQWPHVAATRVMWRHVGPSSWVRLQSELLQVLQPQNGDKQPNLDTGDITAKRRWQTPKLYGFCNSLFEAPSLHFTSLRFHTFWCQWKFGCGVTCHDCAIVAFWQHLISFDMFWRFKLNILQLLTFSVKDILEILKISEILRKWFF